MGGVAKHCLSWAHRLVVDSSPREACSWQVRSSLYEQKLILLPLKNKRKSQVLPTRSIKIWIFIETGCGIVLEGVVNMGRWPVVRWLEWTSGSELSVWPGQSHLPFLFNLPVSIFPVTNGRIEFLLGTNVSYKPVLKGKRQVCFYSVVTNNMIREGKSPTFMRHMPNSCKGSICACRLVSFFPPPCWKGCLGGF